MARPTLASHPRSPLRAGPIPYLFLLPAALVLATFWFVPLAMAFGLSFFKYNPFLPAEWVGLANYARLLGDPGFWRSLLVSGLYLAAVVPPLVVLPLFLAVLVNRELPGIGAFRAAYYLPVVVSMVVVGLMWKWILAENGLLNGALAAILPHFAPVAWLARPETALLAVAAVTVWKGLGYYMVVYLAGLQTIGPEIYESAALDGASRWQQTIYLTVPLLWPSVAFVAIVSSISALKAFTEIFVMTKGGPLEATTTGVYYLYTRAFEAVDYGYANAVGVVLFLVIAGLSALNLRAFEGGARQP